MTNMKKTLLTIGTLLLTGVVQAQEFTNDWGNYSKPSPGGNTGSIDANVNEATGAISYGVNLYSFNQNGSSFPISLSYYSTGVKVDDYASFVGLGWNLNAGGMITKIVRGLDDEDATKGYRANFSTFTSVTKEQVRNGDKDGEPDMYVFNCFGRSGKFVFNPATSQYISLNADDILIQKVNLPSPHFEITDEAGIVYHFTLEEQTTTKTVNTYGGGTPLNETVVSGWFLTKVVLADHSEIRLNYVSRTITDLITSTKETDIVRFENGNPSCTDAGDVSTPGSIVKGEYRRVSYYASYNTHRISNITFSTGSIDFIYSTTGRTDIAGDYALESVWIRDNQNMLLNKYGFSYGSHSNRLLLTGVAKFTGYATVSLNVNTFSYYMDYTLPSPGSTVSQDEFGYYNGAPSVNKEKLSNVPTLLPSLTASGYFAINGASREFGPVEKMQTLMLKSITNLEGGKLTVSYEPNFYYKDGLPPNSKQGPGLRVTLLTSDDNNHHLYYTRYKYEDQSGQSTGIYINQYAYNNTIGPVTILVLPMDPVPGYYVVPGCSGSLRFSEKRVRLPMALSSPVYYREVRSMQFSDRSNEASSSNGFTIKNFTYDEDIYTPSMHGIREYKFGNLSAVKTYDKAGNIVSSQTFAYTYSDEISFPAKFAHMTALTYQAVPQGFEYVYHYELTQYNLYAGRRNMVKVSAQTYGTNASVMHIKEDEFLYDSHRNIYEAKQSFNGALRHRTIYKRSYEYGAQATGGDQMNKALNYMKNNHIHSPVIESIVTTNGASETVTGGAVQLYKFDAARQVVLPTKQLTLRQTGRTLNLFARSAVSGGVFSYAPTYEVQMEIDAIDTNDLPMQINSRKDTVAMFNNHYGQTYCTTSKALLSEIAYCGFEYSEAKTIEGAKPIVGNFNFAVGCGPISNDAFLGRGAFNLAACGSNIETSNTLVPAKKYILQCWKKGNLTISTTGGTITGTVLRTSGDWQLMEYEVNGTTFVKINGTAMIDEIKLFPSGAAMSSTSYDRFANVIAESDANNQVIRYEYDEYGRIRNLLNVDKNIIKQFEYGIQIPQ